MDDHDDMRRRGSSHDRRARRSSARNTRSEISNETRQAGPRPRRSSNNEFPPTSDSQRDGRTRSRRGSSAGRATRASSSSSRPRSSSPSQRHTQRRSSDAATRSTSKHRSSSRTRSRRNSSSTGTSNLPNNHRRRSSTTSGYNRQRENESRGSNKNVKHSNNKHDPNNNNNRNDNDKADDDDDDDDRNDVIKSPRRRRHRRMWDEDVEFGNAAGDEHELADGTQAVAHLKVFNLERLAGLLFRKGTAALLRCLDHRWVSPLSTSLGVGLRPLLNADFESTIRHGYGRNAVVKVHVQRTDELSEDPLLFHPIVRVSVVNGATGFLLAKTDLNRPATSFGESCMTIKVRTLAKGQIRIEREESECAVVVPQLTAPCEIQGGSARVVAPSWAQQDPIIFNIDYSELLRPNVLIFFELLDFGDAIPFDRISKRDGFYHIAWAFLKPVSSTHQPNVPVAPAKKFRKGDTSREESEHSSNAEQNNNSSSDDNAQEDETNKKQKSKPLNETNQNNKEHQPMRLQFYRYPSSESFLNSAYEEREYRGERGNWPYVFHVYRLIHRVKYPSTLYVTVEGTIANDTAIVTQRATIPTQQEVYPQSLEELIEDEILGAGQNEGEDGAERNVVMARRFRMKHEECLIPTQLAGRLPVGNMGCFAVEFSPDGRLLAAACADDNTHFPVRVFVVASGKLKCCLYAHKSLVYEISWQHPATTHDNEDDDDDDDDQDGNSDMSSDEGGEVKHIARPQVPAAVEGYQLATASADGCALVWWIPGGARRKRSQRAGGAEGYTGRTDETDTSRKQDNGDPHDNINGDQDDDDGDDDDDVESQRLLGGAKNRRKKERKRERIKAAAMRRNGGGGVAGAGISPRIVCRLSHDPPVYVYTVQHHPVAKDPVVVMTGSYDGIVRLWDTETGECFGALDKGRRHHVASVNSIVFTPDGQRLISGDAAGVVNVWRLETGKQASDPNAWHLARSIKDPDLVGKSVTSVRTHPKEKLLLVSAHGRTLLLFEMRRYTRVHRSFAGSSILKSMIRASFSADGKYVLAGGEDGCPHFWNTITSLGAAASRWQGRACFGKPMYDVAWHPSEHLVAFASFGGDFPILFYDTNRNSAVRQLEEFDDADATAKAREEMERRDNRHRLHMLKTNKIVAKLATLTPGNKENRGETNGGGKASVPKLRDLVTLRGQSRGIAGGTELGYTAPTSSADATSALTTAASLTLSRSRESPISGAHEQADAAEWRPARRDSNISMWSSESMVAERIAKATRRRGSDGSVASVVTQARELLRRTSVDLDSRSHEKAAGAAVAAVGQGRRKRNGNQKSSDEESSDDDL